MFGRCLHRINPLKSCYKGLYNMLDLKIRTLVIEKDEHALGKTLAVLQNVSQISVVGKATSGNMGFTLGNRIIPQLVFINVDLPDVNGIEFVRMLRNKNINPEIVFLANDSTCIFESLPLEPFDFFVTPLNKDLLSQMIDRLIVKYKKRELIRKMDLFVKSLMGATKRIFPQKKGIIVIALDEIIFCKAELTCSKLQLSNGEDVLIKMRLKDTLETLNKSDFIRTGRSYFINRNYLRKIDKKHLKCVLSHLGQNWEVPVSKSTIGILEKLNSQPIY